MSELHQAKAGARRGERRGAGSNKPANHLADEDQWSAGPGMGWAIWGGWWRSNSYAPGRGLPPLAGYLGVEAMGMEVQ